MLGVGPPPTHFRSRSTAHSERLRPLSRPSLSAVAVPGITTTAVTLSKTACTIVAVNYEEIAVVEVVSTAMSSLLRACYCRTSHPSILETIGSKLPHAVSSGSRRR